MTLHLNKITHCLLETFKTPIINVNAVLDPTVQELSEKISIMARLNDMLDQVGLFLVAALLVLQIIHLFITI